VAINTQGPIVDQSGSFVLGDEPQHPTSYKVLNGWALAATSVIVELEGNAVHFKMYRRPRCTSSICNQMTLSSHVCLRARAGQFQLSITVDLLPRTLHFRFILIVMFARSVLCRTGVRSVRLRYPTAYSPGCCVKHTIRNLFHIFCIVILEQKKDHANNHNPRRHPSVHDHAIKVDAVAESYLNVGGICCLVL
jgi:hypothetical protein